MAILLIVAGVVVLLLTAVAVPSTATEHPEHCGDTTASTLAPGSTGAEGDRAPSGNNGTVKIDGCELDQGVGPLNDKPGMGDPDNEPHIGCLVTVDWYGYEEGEFFSDVVFEVWPPTGGQVPITATVTDWREPGDGHGAFATPTVGNSDDAVYIGEDDATGGGSAAGIDAAVTYDMTEALESFEAHPQHGWHVKLTIHAEDSRGADVKHKVFWTGPCEVTTTEDTTTTTTGGTTTTTTGGTTTTTTGGTTTTTSGGDTTTTTTRRGGPPTSTGGPSVGGVSVVAPTGAPAVAPAPAPTAGPAVLGVQLARTGSTTTVLLVMAGLALLLGGSALLAAQAVGRRPSAD